MTGFITRLTWFSTLVEEACWILAWGRSIKKAPAPYGEVQPSA
jgi:hypothetical protein